MSAAPSSQESERTARRDESQSVSPALEKRAGRAPSPISAKAILLGIALMFGNAYLLFQGELVQGASLSNAAPFANAIFFLALLTLLNGIAKRRFPRLALRPAELLVLYVMLSLQSVFGARTCLYWLLLAITYGFRFDSPENDWAARFGPHLPHWLTVRDKDALRDFYLGNSTLFTQEHLAVWLTPVLMWSVFFCVLGAVLIALSALFSRQWNAHERLTYPVVELPYRMVTPESGFWRQRVMWMGFALAAGIGLLNGLHAWFPSLPMIPVKRMNLALMFTAKPWDAIKELNLSFYPFIVGLAFLMPLDLSFSAVFFLLLARAEDVFGSASGLDGIPNFPFMRQQQFGAALAILCALLWGSRHHLRHILRAVRGLPSALTDPAEVRLYRHCLLTLGLGSVFLVAFLMAAGMSWWVAGVFLLVFYGMGLVVARVRAELGFPTHPLFGLNGSNALMMTAGSGTLGLQNVTLLGVSESFNLYNSHHALPHQMEGLRMADRGGVETGTMIRLMLVATLVGVLITFGLNLTFIYSLGAAAKMGFAHDFGRYTWEQTLPVWAQMGKGALFGQPQWTSLGVMGLSFSFCCLLMQLRYRYLWFPLHPLGMVLGNTTNDVWTAIALAMFLKWATLRYLGLRGYRAALPFFLGLVLGDMTMGMTWVIIGALCHTPTYVFFL